MKTSITFYPNSLKKNRKTGKTPMYLRICSQRKKAESRLNAEVSEHDLLKWDLMNMRFSGRNFFVNHLLNSIDKKFQDFVIINATSLSKLIRQKYVTIFLEMKKTVKLL